MILGYQEQPKKIGNDYSWRDEDRSYMFTPIEENKKGMITTAAFMMCHNCGIVIKSMGGPGRKCYCLTCYDVLKVEDFSQGFTHEIITR